MRLLAFLLAAAAAVFIGRSAIGQQAHTTRIEHRPYYGAIVSKEHGVRVIRPLPPTQHMIINPDGKTPLVLGGDGSRVINQNAQSVTVTRGR